MFVMTVRGDSFQRYACVWARAGGTHMERTRLPIMSLLILIIALANGCAVKSMYLQNPQTGYVVKCDSIFGGAWMIGRESREECAVRWMRQGYTKEVEADLARTQPRADR